MSSMVSCNSQNRGPSDEDRLKSEFVVKESYDRVSQQGRLARWTSRGRQCVLWLFYFAVSFAALVVHANTETRVIDHGQSDDEPRYNQQRYIVYQNVLYYTLNGQLYSLASPDAEPQALPLATGFRTDAWAVFDGKLFLQSGGGLYRLDSDAGQLTRIVVPPIIPPELTFDGDTTVRTSEFAVYQGRLYFVGQVAYSPCQAVGAVFETLWRLDSAESEPVQIWRPVITDCSLIDRLTSTPDGLVYLRTRAGYRGTIGYNTISRIVSPLSVSNPPTAATSYGLVTNYGFQLNEFGRVDDRVQSTLPWLGGSIFYSGIQLEPSSPNAPDPGPFPHPGDVYYPWEAVGSTEPYRLVLDSGDYAYFDINQTSDQTDLFFAERTIGDSKSDFYQVVNGVVYFRAQAEDGEPQLYRIVGVDGIPEMMALNPNGPSNAVPLGGMNDRLWFAADTGAGLDLHYLDDDGRSAVPLGVGAAVANTANYLTQFQGSVVFSATDENQRKGTWIISATEKTDPGSGDGPDKGGPDKDGSNGKQPSSGDHGGTKTKMTSHLRINGRRSTAKKPYVSKRRARLRVSCDARNRTTAATGQVRTTIVEQFRSKTRSELRFRRLKTCSRKALAAGNTARCTVTRRAASSGRTRYRCETQTTVDNGTVSSNASGSVIVRR